MKKRILVSIIIPVFNEASFISKCLDSVLNLDFKKDKYEIIVVNDGSTDGTKNILKSLCEKNDNLYLFSKPNGGKGSAQNLGIKKAKGEIIAITDSDCIVPKDWLKKILEALQNSEYVQGLCFPIDCNTVVEKIQYSEALVKLKYSRNNSTYVSGANNAFRKSLIDDIGLFSEETPSPTEDFIERLKIINKKIYFSPEIIVYTKFESKLKNYIIQKLRWRRISNISFLKIKSMSLSKFLSFNFTILFSFIQFFVILYSFYTENYNYFLGIILISFSLELAVRFNGIINLFKSKEVSFMPYYILSVFLAVFFIRNFLPTYLFYHSFFSRGVATFAR